jgi:hypothetical protein
MHHHDLVERQTQDFVRDLRQRGFQSLAVALDADAQFQPAIRGHARDGLLEAGDHRDAPAGVDRRAVRRLLAEDREADAGADRAGLGRLARRMAGMSIAATTRRRHSG